MLDDLLRRVQAYTPLMLGVGAGLPEAAVLVPITRSAEPELVLTLRADGLSTHGGEVAFPGGRRDPEDLDLIGTALSLERQRERDHRLVLLDERTIIARELHDSLAQALTYMKLQVSRMQTLIRRGSQSPWRPTR